MIDLGKVILELKLNRFRWRSSQFWYLFLSALSFCCFTYYLGLVEGWRDKSETDSQLPLVSREQDPSESWRLILSDSDNLYLWKMTSEGPAVRIVSADKASNILIKAPRGDVPSVAKETLKKESIDGTQPTSK